MPNATRETPPVAPATQPTDAKTYLRATLKDGTQIVSEFARLSNVQKYAAQIFARVNVFNAWQIVSRVHPASGEPCLVRRRRMLSGELIAEIERVVPLTFEQFVEKAGEMSLTLPLDEAEGRALYQQRVNDLLPEMFDVALDIQAGAYGSWIAPLTDAPEGARPGMRYPIHRDPATLERYVILRVAQGEQPETRFALDAGRSTAATTVDALLGDRIVDEDDRHLPADGDEDDGF